MSDRGIYVVRYAGELISFIYHYTQPRYTGDNFSLLSEDMFTGFQKGKEHTISRRTIENLLNQK